MGVKSGFKYGLEDTLLMGNSIASFGGGATLPYLFLLSNALFAGLNFSAEPLRLTEGSIPMRTLVAFYMDGKKLLSCGFISSTTSTLSRRAPFLNIPGFSRFAITFGSYAST